MARSKYNVSSNKAKRSYDGIVFASELEMKYYRDVVLPAYNAGEIVKYELQKKYELQPAFKRDRETVRAIFYVADFYIEYADGRIEVIDTKGKADATALMKRKMFYYHFPTLIYRWVGYSKIDGGWCDYEYIQQQRKLRKKEKEQSKNEKTDS